MILHTLTMSDQQSSPSRVEMALESIVRLSTRRQKRKQIETFPNLVARV